MKTINLITPEKSDVAYKLTTFPDGEPHIRISNEIDRKEEYNVICRICNPSDLFVVMQVGDILNRQSVTFSLTIIYLMSMRMDRVVNFEEAFTLRVVANAINSLKAKKVYVYEAHSSRTFAEIENSEPLLVPYPNLYIERGVGLPTLKVSDNGVYSFNILCFPDNGAYLRYGEMGGLDDNMLCILDKHRDLKAMGAIMSLDFLKKPQISGGNKHFLLVDDLCDGGSTFVGAAELLKKEYPTSEFSIFVRHMVNPRGLENLPKNYNYVFITDSYKDWSNEIKEKGYVNVRQISIC